MCGDAGLRSDARLAPTRRTFRVAVAILPIFAAVVRAEGPGAADVVGRWTFDALPDESAGGVLFAGTPGPAAAVRGSAVTDAFVPDAYVYDPLTGASRENQSSLRVEGRALVEIAERTAGQLWRAGRSFTLEVFARPRTVATSVIALKSRRDPRRTQFALQPQRSAGVPFFGGWFQSGEAAPIRWTTGHYLGVSRLNPTALDWRHLAVVYDAPTKTFTLFTGYYESASRVSAEPFAPDDGPLLLGGSGDGDGFDGWLDEVRVTAAALRPEHFLRARTTPLSDARFDSQATLLPRDSGYVDLKTAFGAVGDGKTDDTAALQRAFRELANRVPLAYPTLYIPPGTYLISDHVRWSRFLVVQGAGRDKTILRLKDDCPGYADVERPKSVVGMGYSAWGEWGRGAGNAIGNYLFDLTIDVGRGNPAAVALDHHSNNHGAVERVDLRSGDGRGLIGLSFLRPWPGPALIKHVSIRGFDYGLRMAHQEYSVTIEHLTLEDQRRAGIELRGNILNVRKLTSRNRVPAVVAEGGNTMLTLLDSELAGGANDVAAVRSAGGLYVRNLRTSGYRAAIEQQRMSSTSRERPISQVVDTRTVDGPEVAEFVGGRIVCPRGTATGSLKLPIEETPEVPWGDPQIDWVNIRTFAAEENPDDWTAALQQAIDSGARTIFFPPGRYDFAGTVRLHGRLERLTSTGMVRLSRKKTATAPPPQPAPPAEPPPDRQPAKPRTEPIAAPLPETIPPDDAPPPVLMFDDVSAGKTIVVERLDVDGLTHASPGTLVVRHCTPVPYRNTAGCGKLFLENTMAEGWRFDHPQKVWVRQWNPESHAPGPCILSRGATLWCLGFKTEYESSKLWAFDGAQTEILGAFIYPIGKIPADRPIFKNVDSRMAVSYGASIYTSNHKVHIVDRRGDDVLRIDNDDLHWHGSRARMDLYVSDPAASGGVAPAAVDE